MMDGWRNEDDGEERGVSLDWLGICNGNGGGGRMFQSPFDSLEGPCT